jgi:putative ABC transport system permease protein
MITHNNFTTAFYSLSKAKGYAATIVLTLGITLGALVAMFNLNYQLLATPLPYPDQERLYIAKPNVYLNGRLEFSGSVPYPALVEAYKAKEPFLEKKALLKSGKNIIRNLSATPQVSVSYVTPEFLQLLGTPMQLGRVFNDQEGLYSLNPVTVISYNAWQKLFNRDPDIVGKSVQIGEVSFKVIGVIADNFIEPTFDGNGLKTQIWLPWDYALLDDDSKEAWGRFRGGQHIVGKLKVGQQTRLVEQALSIDLSSRFAEQIQDSHLEKLELEFKLVGYQDAILGDVKGRLLLLFSGALVLLLIAMSNITSLMLARVSNQQKALAIRAALGAQKRHLFSDIMGEILLLVLSALGLALLVSQAGVNLIKVFAEDQLPRVAELHLTWQSLLFTAVCGLLVAFSFALVVSHQINYSALHSLLQGSGKGTGIQVSANVRRLLIASQVTLTTILLAASLQVLVQSLTHIRQPLGFATDGIHRIILNISPPPTIPISQQQKADLLAIHHALSTSPKIASASLASDAPTSLNQLQDYLSLTPDYKELKRSLATFIDQRYLPLFGFELIAGRNFTAAEFNQGAQVIIINENLIARFSIVVFIGKTPATEES